MEDRLKERLTGAILLLVLVVGLVPEIFRGEHSSASGAAGTAADTSQHLYTIDLKGAKPAPDETVVATQPATLPAEVEAPPEPAQEPAPPAASSAAHKPAPVAVAPPAAPPAAPAASRSASSAPAAHPPAKADSGFAVQIGSFSSREHANTLLKQAAKKGVRVVIVGPDDRGVFRVRSPVVHTRQEAVTIQERLRAQGFKGVIGPAN